VKLSPVTTHLIPHPSAGVGKGGGRGGKRKKKRLEGERKREGRQTLIGLIKFISFLLNQSKKGDRQTKGEKLRGEKGLPRSPFISFLPLVLAEGKGGKGELSWKKGRGGKKPHPSIHSFLLFSLLWPTGSVSEKRWGRGEERREEGGKEKRERKSHRLSPLSLYTWLIKTGGRGKKEDLSGKGEGKPERGRGGRRRLTRSSLTLLFPLFTKGLTQRKKRKGKGKRGSLRKGKKGEEVSLCNVRRFRTVP